MDQSTRDKTKNEDRTTDSRFLVEKLKGGETKLYMMYSHNIHVEGDGLAYHELNLLRAVLLEPILFIIMKCNLLLAHRQGIMSQNPDYTLNPALRMFAHILGFVSNILRLAMSIVIFVTEFILWPIRFVLGILLSPIGLFLSYGYIYALPFSVMHSILREAGPAVIRKVQVQKLSSSQVKFREKFLNAGGLGKVDYYEAMNAKDASYVASTLKIQQRCGIGPECILVRGRKVFVSSWPNINLSSVFGMVTEEWKLLDISNFEWRIMQFTFLNGEGCSSDHVTISVRNTETSSQEGGSATFPRGTWVQAVSTEDLGKVSTLAELETYYRSPLGWNKCRLMRREACKVSVTRNDRRVIVHLIAIVVSLLVYLEFRDTEDGLSMELAGLIVAGYALITAYAAEMVVGKVHDVVDAKSERYGIIVTRAIDIGYVRGFHVQNGDTGCNDNNGKWLRYENGDETLAAHTVQGIEVNAVCNSVVDANRERVKVISYTWYDDSTSNDDHYVDWTP